MGRTFFEQMRKAITGIGFERYAKLGTVPYGSLRLDKEPKIGDELVIPEKSNKRGCRKIKVKVININDNCVFLSR